VTGNVSRVLRSKDDARDNYNRLSRWYDLLAGRSEEKYRQIGVRLLNLKPGEKVLEIGFGTGHCLEAFASAIGADGLVCGIELSDGMAAIVQKRMGGADTAYRVNLTLADGVQIPFSSRSFDAVFMSFTLELFDSPEIPRVLRDCKQVLRQGGRMVVVTLAKKTPPSIAEVIYEWFHNRMPILVDCRPILPQSALLEAGFDVQDVIMETMWGLPVEIVAAVNR
jgi:demethylmenaquinone methyltransferase/2-methoxy-6-polyprenyl-1,4-benzoquinol methylase